MKILLTLGFSALLTFTAFGQTATNFNCNDCAGINHDLFSELDAGKVIVISWVMPCGNCIGPTLTASNIVLSYASTNPGQVFLYVVDDYANTNCTALNGWCATNGITATTFSDASINMLDYNATPGMPKIVVLGGSSHTIYFNEVNAAAGNAPALQSAIDSALLTGVNEPYTVFNDLLLSPNPAAGLTALNISLREAADVRVELVNSIGQTVSCVFSGMLEPGEHTVTISVAGLPAGIYFVQVSDAAETRMMRLEVTD